MNPFTLVYPKLSDFLVRFRCRFLRRFLAMQRDFVIQQDGNQFTIRALRDGAFKVRTTQHSVDYVKPDIVFAHLHAGGECQVTVRLIPHDVTQVSVAVHWISFKVSEKASENKPKFDELEREDAANVQKQKMTMEVPAQHKCLCQ